MLPELLDQTLAEYEIEMAYALGELAERRRIATAVAELDATAIAAGVDSYRDRVQERLDLFASLARSNFPGGPTMRRSSTARAVRPFRFKHDPAAYEFVPDDGPDSALVLVTPVPWEPEDQS